MSLIRGSAWPGRLLAAMSLLAFASCEERPAGEERPPIEEAADAGTTISEEELSCDGVVPGPQYSRRLTHREYVGSLQALTGGSSALVKELPTDGSAEEFAFDNHATVLRVSTSHAEKYALIAEEVARDVMASPTRKAKVVGCDLAKGATCMESFIRDFGRRAYRRPLTEDEVTALKALAATETDAKMGAELVLTALLQSPNFLHRVEVGVPSTEKPGLHQLTGYEVATRLSFLFQGAPPNDALLDRALRGELDTAEGVASAARELLASSPLGAKMHLRGFYTQWLQLSRLDSLQRDATRYPLWSPKLAESMREEVHRVVDDHLWGGNRDFLGVLTAKHSYLDGELAQLYGLPAPAGDGFTRVELGPQTGRGGLLTLGGVLSVMANSEGVAPILRGKFVRVGLLCDPPPPVPEDVPDFPEQVEGESERARLERHRGAPACAGCHQSMDPIGFGLEQYDAIGKHRAVDSGGHPLSGEGNIFGMKDGAFKGPFELGQKLREAPEVSACVVRQAFRWSAGRFEQPADKCALHTLTKSFRESGHDLPELLVTLTQSDAFRFVDPSLSLSQRENE